MTEPRYRIVEQKNGWELSVWGEGWLLGRWRIVGRHLSEGGAFRQMQELARKKMFPQPPKFFDCAGSAMASNE